MKVFIALEFISIKKYMFGSRGVNCVFIGYPRCVKGYKLRKMEYGLLKFIISKEIYFDDICTRMKLNNFGVK